jgi:phosphosulfolactate phosphohydrolase-like enzyme
VRHAGRSSRLTGAAVRTEAGVGATLSESTHARTLVGLGFREDVAFAGRRNTLDVVAQRDTDTANRFRRADQGRSAGPPNRRAAASRR